jgi:uncharacterized Fe-S radical SAM superfamily protein PflX
MGIFSYPFFCISSGSLIPQYRPSWHAAEIAHEDPVYRGLKRPITGEEYRYAIRCAKEAGLHRGFEVSL